MNQNGSGKIVRKNDELKSLLRDRDEHFWQLLADRSADAQSFTEIIALASLRKKAEKLGVKNETVLHDHPLRIALIGGSTLYPFSELIEHLTFTAVGPVEVKSGDFNNYRAEITEETSFLYDLKPDVVIIIPDAQNCRYTGGLTDPKDEIESAASSVCDEILQLAALIRENLKAEVIISNFILPPFTDPGPLRTRSASSDWNFKKTVNLMLGTRAPNYLHICDLEFLSYRHGGLNSIDENAWFESKQLCSPSLMAFAAHEIAHLIRGLRETPKKVVVLDLDNTLWGGVIGDDGMTGIEIGDTSPRGEAFKAFQQFIKTLISRGILLGVCSKNDFENAVEPFRRHPEMVLKETDFVSFKANWEPKAQNLIEMADELNLGLDSFVFIDDNPAEIEIVKQFAPDVTTILLGPDPALYVRQLKESRLFERFALTEEDAERTEQYRKEKQRKSLLETAVDMDSYLSSLEMTGSFKRFDELDLPRIAQLINKSNQFNLTTRRRTQAEIEQLMRDPNYVGFTMRLSDKFGDHGLISIVILRSTGTSNMEIDTWLMSCRVLKRQVEEEVVNEFVRIARLKNVRTIKGIFKPTAKNSMVKDLYPAMGFTPVKIDENRSEFELETERFQNKESFITIDRRTKLNEQGRSFSRTAEYI